jgi:DNA adenine methylase
VRRNLASYQPYPIVKWVGGKRQLQDSILERIGDNFGTYFEPFFGGGAILFALNPAKAEISDVNQGLVNLYSAIKFSPVEFMDQASQLEKKYNELNDLEKKQEFFYVNRDAYNSTERVGNEQAARFLFLNKSCFNGMYRENSKGLFNVPFGKRAILNLYEAANVNAVSSSLQGVGLNLQSYAETIADAKAGDVVYFDPPYIPLTVTSAFTSYTAEGFGMDAQVELANIFRELDSKGVRVLLSNSSAPVMNELYEGYKLTPLSANRAISAKAPGRAKVTEYLVDSELRA